MNYLKEYGLNDNQINNIREHFIKEDGNNDIFEYSVKKVRTILDLFQSIGVKNLYDVIITGSDMFFDPIDSVIRRVEKYPDKKELPKLINEDVYNLILVDLL